MSVVVRGVLSEIILQHGHNAVCVSALVIVVFTLTVEIFQAEAQIGYNVIESVYAHIATIAICVASEMSLAKGSGFAVDSSKIELGCCVDAHSEFVVGKFRSLHLSGGCRVGQIHAGASEVVEIGTVALAIGTLIE